MGVGREGQGAEARVEGCGAAVLCVNDKGVDGERLTGLQDAADGIEQ